MRKLIYSALAAIGLLLSPSCSDENEVVNGSGNEALVSFTVNLADGIQTKAISDGTTANTLYYKVYDSSGTELDVSGSKAINKTTTVNLDLVKGKTYNFLFWAQYEGENWTPPYQFGPGGTITVTDYNNSPDCNEEKRDAFFATKQNFTVTGSFTENVTLERPFAQLNFLTTKKDIEDALAGHITTEPKLQSSVTLSKVATTLHPFTNTVSGEATDVEFKATLVPVTFDTNGTVSTSSDQVRIKDRVTVKPSDTGYESATAYYYLATNYFLIGNKENDRKLITATMKIDGADGKLEVNNVPVEWNYRTNIYGDLLTASNKFNVIINPGYTDDENNANEDINSAHPVTVASTDEIATQITNGSRDVTCTQNINSNVDIVIPLVFSDADKNLSLKFTGTVTDGTRVTIKAADGTTGAPKEVLVKTNGGDLTVDLEHSTVTLTGTVNNVISSTAPTTLIIASDMVVKQSITADKGGVLVLGQVGTELSAGSNAITATDADATVTIQQGASVTGNVKAKNDIVVHGSVTGDLKSDTKIQLSSEATVTGDLTADTKEIAPGATAPNIDEYTIRTADDLFAFAKQVNEEGNTYADQTVVLANDINLAGRAWTPIGSNADGTNKFQGTFEGQNHTISNLKVQQGAAYHAAGFFGALNGTAKNFTIDGATITSMSAPNDEGKTDNGTAVVAGSIYTTGAIEAVTVRNAQVKGNRYVGGIAGYVYGSIKDCTVENSTITSTPDNLTGSYDNGDKAGGIAGAFWDENTYEISNCQATNVTIQAYRDFGGIVGHANNGDKVTNCRVSSVTLIQDYSLISEAKNTVGAIIGRNEANNKQPVDGELADQVTKMIGVGTASMLKSVLEAVGSGTGNQIVAITNNIDFTGANFLPIYVDGYHGAGVVTIEGNGHTFTGLKDALFSGGFAGESGVVIKNLTIDGRGVTIENSTDDLGWGYFIKNIDSMPMILLENCHLKNANVNSTGGARVGGLIGWTAGYNNPNDGPVDTYVTITNCSVTNSSITAKGSVGAIIGHAGNNPATYHTITGCMVTNCTLHSTDDGDWRVGVVVGTANVGQVTISGTTENGNTLTQEGKDNPEHSNLYGRFVPGDSGKLTINGEEINN